MATASALAAWAFFSSAPLPEPEPEAAAPASSAPEADDAAAAKQQALCFQTADGSSFVVDGAAGPAALLAVPETHRAEVAAQLRALRQLACGALGLP